MRGRTRKAVEVKKRDRTIWQSSVASDIDESSFSELYPPPSHSSRVGRTLCRLSNLKGWLGQASPGEMVVIKPLCTHSHGSTNNQTLGSPHTTTATQQEGGACLALQPVGPNVALTRPNLTKSIYGGGNCLFRCISYVIIGSQEHHMAV